MGITLTSNALEHLLSVSNQIENQIPIVRFKIKGGGCAGAFYFLDFVGIESLNEDDNAFEFETEQGNLILVVDPKSYLYTNGTVIGFQKTLLDSKFVFDNPLATGGCGCGKSFSIDI